MVNKVKQFFISSFHKLPLCFPFSQHHKYIYIDLKFNYVYILILDSPIYCINFDEKLLSESFRLFLNLKCSS